jgi:hypothetical protein
LTLSAATLRVGVYSQEIGFKSQELIAASRRASNNLLRIASLVPKISLSRRRVDGCVQFRIFADIGRLILRQWG